MIQDALKQLIEKKDLDKETMRSAMLEIMQGQATPAQIAGFMVALRMKGESVTEITAAVEVMRELATKITLEVNPLVDTCGTGGDGVGIFNISTATSFIIAAADVYVAKHGNRSVSTKTGSADVLETAGVNLDLTPEQVAQCIQKVKLGFLFAPKHHSAMKHAIGPRKELGIRTLFNILGPLSNPANPPYQLIGTFSKQWLKPLAEVLKNLGSKQVLLVHSQDGLDEISIAAPTDVVELKDNSIVEYTLYPKDVGLEKQSLDTLKVNSSQESLDKIKNIFQGQQCAGADMLAFNAGAALYIAGRVKSIREGVIMAKEILASGAANRKLQELIDFSKNL